MFFPILSKAFSSLNEAGDFLNKGKMIQSMQLYLLIPLQFMECGTTQASWRCQLGSAIGLTRLFGDTASKNSNQRSNHVWYRESLKKARKKAIRCFQAWNTCWIQSILQPRNSLGMEGYKRELQKSILKATKAWIKISMAAWLETDGCKKFIK